MGAAQLRVSWLLPPLPAAAAIDVLPVSLRLLPLRAANAAAAAAAAAAGASTITLHRWPLVGLSGRGVKVTSLPSGTSTLPGILLLPMSQAFRAAAVVCALVVAAAATPAAQLRSRDTHPSRSLCRYHGDDGHAFSGRGTGRAYGPIYSTGQQRV